MCRICGSNVDCGIAPIDKRIAFHEVDETVWLETNRHRLFIRELAAACGKSIGDSVFEVDETMLPPHVRMVHAPCIEVSSTFVRQALRQGKDVRFFLPAKVYDEVKMLL